MTIYKIGLACYNCLKTINYNIDKGQKIDKFIKENACNNCGCLTLVSKLELNRKLFEIRTRSNE